MEQKKHFKLYKSGKQWITAAIATVAVSTGIILGGVAQADTTDSADNQSVATQPISDQQENNNNSNNNKQTQTLKTFTTESVAEINHSQESVNNNDTPPKEPATLEATPSQTQSYDQNDNGSYGNFDSIEVNNNQLHVTGWQATNQAAAYGNQNRFLIVIGHNDKGEQAELGRTKLNNQTIVQRPDVKNVHNVYNAENSGFDARIQLDTNKLNTYRNAIQIVSRYSGSADGNSQFVDYVSAPVIFDRQNYAWLDEMGVVNNQLHVTGWNATNKALGKDNHYIILFDRTLGHEITRKKVNNISRIDVAEAYPQVINAEQSGFTADFSLNNLDLTHELQIISRYSDADNGEGNYVSYWLAPQRLLPQEAANQGYIDQFNISKNGKVTVIGWHASDVATVENNRFLILFDQTAGHQIASTKISNVTRPDVAQAYPNIKDALDSGFNVTFDVNPADIVFGHQYSIVSRYSTDPNGNGNDGKRADFWSPSIVLNQSANAIDQLYLTNNGIHVTGWMASDASATQNHPYILVMNNGKEITRKAVQLSTRSDVAKVYPSIFNSENSGFNTTINLPKEIDLSQLKDVQILLRFSAADDGNPTATLPVTDQWSNKYDLTANQGSFDYVKVNGNTVEVQGWHASNLSYGKPYQYIIVLQNGREIGRSIVMGSESNLVRPDVERVFPGILNSGQSGFQSSVVLNTNLRNTAIQLIHRFTDDPVGNGNYIDINSPVYVVKDSYQTSGSFNSDSMRVKRDLTAQRIAQKLMQQQGISVLYDWTNQNNNYQELTIHDIAQELAQGDVNNDSKVINEKLHNNALLDGNVISTAIYDLPQTMDYNQLADNFINNLPTNMTLNNSVVGVGVANNKLAIVLFKPGEQALTEKATSNLIGQVAETYKNAGVAVDVENGLQTGAEISTTDLGEAFKQVSPMLLTGEKGTVISYDTLKTIFAALPGNATALEGSKNYYNNNDAYHYQFWLAGQTADDKLNNFLALNKNAKYGDQLKVAYTATLVYGSKTGSQTEIVNMTPTSKKTADEVALAYQNGTETGARYETVKVDPIPNMKQDTIRGVDVSSYLALVKNGVQFYDFDGQPADLMKVLADAGVNYIRIRMWVDPYNAAGESYGGGIDDEATVLQIAENAKKYGMKVLLGLHYSDFWADPATQLVPKQWKNLDDKDLNDEIYLYTKKLVNDFTKAGVNIDMAQLGNEITKGILGVRNEAEDVNVWQTEPQVSRMTSYISSASRAFRESSPDTQLAIHIETPDMHNYDMIMNALQTHNVDYDVLGSSYYPFWGWGGNNPDNIANVEKMVKDKYGKKFMIAESGWPFTLENADGTPNNVSWDPGHYAVSPQGQVDEIGAMYKAILSNDNGLGAFYWEPAWIPVKAGWNNWEYNKLMGDVQGTGWASINARGYYPDSKIMYEGKPASGGTSWDNNTLFDDRGYPLQSLMMYKGFLNGYVSPANVTSPLNAKINALYKADGVNLTNSLKIGDALDLNNVLNQEGQQLLNGTQNTSVSESSLKAIFNDLQDGFKSENYVDEAGNKYHYEFWLDGNNTAEKLSNFLKANQNAKYGIPLTVNYSATLVADKQVETVTSPVNATVSEVWGIDGVSINHPLKTGNSLPAEDLSALQKTVAAALTGEKGTVINAQSFNNLAKVLPGTYGTTGALSGQKIYTLKDGNQYHYEYWLTTASLQAANQGAKYGDPINLTYSASLKWIDPSNK